MKASILLKIHEHGDTTEKLAKVIVSEIKQDCSTYGEVEEAISKIKNELFFYHNSEEKYGSIISRVEEIIEKEKNEMPLTNRSS